MMYSFLKGIFTYHILKIGLLLSKCLIKGKLFLKEGFKSVTLNIKII